MEMKVKDWKSRLSDRMKNQRAGQDERLMSTCPSSRDSEDHWNQPILSLRQSVEAARNWEQTL